MYKGEKYLAPQLTPDDFKAQEENRLTENLLKQKINSVEYEKLGKKTTVCLLTLTNGYEIVGVSACVDPENYVAEIGEEIAFKEAINKLWALEGYLLQSSILYPAEKEG